jgi:hypothetical protein
VVVVPVVVLVVVLLTPMPTGPGPIPALVELVFVTVELSTPESMVESVLGPSAFSALQPINQAEPRSAPPPQIFQALDVARPYFGVCIVRLVS